MQSRTFGFTGTRRRLAAGLLAAAVVSVAATGEARAQASCAGANRIPRAATLDDAATATLCVINRERARRDLPRLHAQDALAQAGRRYARQMARRDFFSHTSPTGSTMDDRLRAVGYAREDMTWTIGEALAWGVGRRATPAGTVAAWMASRPHRRLLLDAGFHDIGIGISVGAPVTPRADGPAATYATELGVRH